MKLTIDILAKDKSLQDFVTASFLKEINNRSNENLSVFLEEDTSDDGLNSREGLFTLIIEVIGGLLTLGELAELIHKHFISKNIDIKIKNNSSDEEITISGDKDLVEIIESRLKELVNNNTNTEEKPK